MKGIKKNSSKKASVFSFDKHFSGGGGQVHIPKLRFFYRRIILGDSRKSGYSWAYMIDFRVILPSAKSIDTCQYF